MVMFIFEQLHIVMAVLGLYVGFTANDSLFKTVTILVTFDNVLDEVTVEKTRLNWSGLVSKVYIPVLCIACGYVWYCIVRGLPIQF